MEKAQKPQISPAAPPDRPVPEPPTHPHTGAGLEAAARMAEALRQKLLDEKRSLAWTQFATD